MEIAFHGKKILVTGAGRGIGRAVVKRLSSSGAKVIALSKTQANLDSLKIELPEIETLCVDISNWSATKSAVEAIGHVELLVNNAGIAVCQDFGEITEDAIDKMFSVNFKALVNISQIVVASMKKQGTGGSIVNVSSVAGILAMAGHAAYGASKAAMDMTTKIMALELGPHKIRVNSVNPTVTWTEMAQVGWSDPKIAEKMKLKTPLRRFSEVEEVVDTIVYLLSDKSSMVTGVIMPVDGGVSV